MFISKIIATAGKKLELRKANKAKIEELAQDMAGWLPPYGYGIKGKIPKRALQIIKQREKEERKLLLAGKGRDHLELEKRMGSNYNGPDNIV